MTTQLLTQIKDYRAQLAIGSLSFPENKINSLIEVGATFPNVKLLNLSKYISNLDKNEIKSMQGIGQMARLTDLYLGENQFKEIVELDNLVNLKYLQLGDNPNCP